MQEGDTIDTSTDIPSNIAPRSRTACGHWRVWEGGVMTCRGGGSEWVRYITEMQGRRVGGVEGGERKEEG